MELSRLYHLTRLFSRPFLWPLRLVAAVVVTVATLTGCEPFFENIPSQMQGWWASAEPPPSSDAPEWQQLPVAGLPASAHHAGAVLAAHPIGADANQLLSIGADGTLIVWDLKAGSGHQLDTLGHSITHATFGARTSLLAYSSSSANTTAAGVTVRCVVGCTEQWRLPRLRVRPTALAFHARDSALLIAGSDGRVYRWRFRAEREARTFNEQERTLERYAAHQNVVSAVAAHPFERAFFSGDWNGALIGWLPYTADAHGGAYDRNVFGARFYADKITFFTATRPPDRGISHIAVGRSGERLAVGTEEGFVEVWDVKGFQLAARYQPHTGRVLAVAIDESGQRVVSVGRDGLVAVALTEPEPAFGVAPQATRERFTPLLSQPLEHASGAMYLANGNVIVTTSDGQVAELSNFKSTAPPPTPTPVPPPRPRDTDYG